MSVLRRVEDQQELERVVDDYIMEGYSIESRGRNIVHLERGEYGSLEAHAIIFMMAGWWTFGAANILYLGYCYVKGEKVTVKID